MKKSAFFLIGAALAVLSCNSGTQQMKLNDLEYFEKTGANVLVYSNIYNGGFCDEKLAGLEIIQRGERIATGGGVRFMNTPEQWDIYATMTDRKVNPDDQSIEVSLSYEDYGFDYKDRKSTV